MLFAEGEERFGGVFGDEGEVDGFWGEGSLVGAAEQSGFDLGTVSTAADQLRIFQAAMRFSVFRQVVSMASVMLPVAGTLTNYNPLIAEGYAGKTGSDSAAGGCLAFFTHVTVSGRGLTAVGVVLGQGQGSDTSVLLGAAGEAAEQLVDSVAPTIASPSVDLSGGRSTEPLTRRHCQPAAQHCPVDSSREVTPRGVGEDADDVLRRHRPPTLAAAEPPQRGWRSL